jgi:hypothetical protein
MSRSYRKYLSRENDEYRNPDWGSIRQNVRSCFSEVFKDKSDNDVLFPLRFRNGDDTKRRYYHTASEIRIEYFTEIRNILNGYRRVRSYGYESDSEEYFLHCYNLIRQTEPDDGSGKGFAWLNTAKAVAAVRAWKGKPLDILPALAKRKIIERAVTLEVKKRNRK